MKVCGIELKGSEAIFCILHKGKGLMEITDTRVRSIAYTNSHEASDLSYFQRTVAKLLEDYQVDNVVIKERAQKGKFAGGAPSFKMEAAIQLLENIHVDILTASESKTLLKSHPISIEFSDTGLKKFQEGAFKTAFAWLNRK